jgi:uncharacterized protein
MSNIAGQTRDESELINCPKCSTQMEQVTFGGMTVDRCTSCKGIWFDAREHERMKEAPGSESIDLGPAGAGAGTTTSGKVQCPVCKTRMILMTDHQQPHIKYESCTVCYGVFFDAGEFRDYKEVTLAESLRQLLGRRR